MVIPRLHSKHLEEIKAYQLKIKKGEFVTKREIDLYDMSSVRSITPNNQHQSMSRNLNEKSRYSLPVNSNEVNQLDEDISEENNEDGMILNQIDFIPGDLIQKSKYTILEKRHNELISELKGSKNKPSILTKYKSITALHHNSASKLGNLTDRSIGAKRSSNDNKNLIASTDFSEMNLNLDILPKGASQNIFELKPQIPKTQRQKELFRRSQNVSLPQLAKHQ